MSKISELVEITKLEKEDIIPVVDMSDGTTKKITASTLSNNLKEMDNPKFITFSTDDLGNAEISYPSWVETMQTSGLLITGNGLYPFAISANGEASFIGNDSNKTISFNKTTKKLTVSGMWGNFICSAILS